MARVLRDRYLAYDRNRGCDLTTGDEVLLDALEDEEYDRLLDRPRDEADLASLVEVLEHGRDGNPRWIVADAENGVQAAALVGRISAAARRRGFVAVAVGLYRRLGGAADDELRDRALLLLGGFGDPPDADCGALLAAAAVSPRPHLLLTIQPRAALGPAMSVREARPSYGAQPGLAGTSPAFAMRASAGGRSPGRAVQMPADVARHLVRAGRHAAAERLLREVAASLERRGAHVPAAQVTLSLGRLLLERGRGGAQARPRSRTRRGSPSRETQSQRRPRPWSGRPGRGSARLGSPRPSRCCGPSG